MDSQFEGIVVDGDVEQAKPLVLLSFDIKADVEIEALEESPLDFVVDHADAAVGPVHEEVALGVEGVGELVFVKLSEQLDAESKLLGIKFLPVEVPRHLPHHILYIPARDGVALQQRAHRLHQVLVLAQLHLHRHHEAHDLVKDRMAEFQDLPVALAQDIRVKRVAHVDG